MPPINKPLTPIAVQKTCHETPADKWPNNKLPCRSPGHTKHLSSTNQSGCAGRWKIFGGDVDGADKRKHSTGPWINLPDTRELTITDGEQQRSDANNSRGAGQQPAWSKAIHRGAGNQTERRVSVVEQSDHGSDSKRCDAEGVADSGIITAGAERRAY